ncbi:Cysteine and histidine-rich domain-containing protein 1 [Orchesella cincta]|uniref:Cysteine and histidine-rich domain-containing protein 1 n=1 Tax=Orchesella cincta TaxID=48709 RepID=A0A1D2NBU8_ORCCI|nr:Cysteine and histidine-rich domain-containing protein 1 [Orchesella cincta]
MKELSDSLKNQTLTTAPSSNGNDVEEDKAQIIPGVTQCVNNGCKVTYQGPETDLEACDHHPGVPIFHEENSHDQGGAKVIKCRNDWHQTGSHVIMYIYAKKFDPNRSEVKIITPEDCSVLMTPMKFEIKLKKAEPVSWKQLALPKEQQIIKTDEIKNEYSVGVDVLDLSDL